MQLNFNLLRRLIHEALLNAYEVLGVSPNASEDQIKSAWKKLALKHHPDRGGKHGDMVDINNAKDRLLNKTDLFRYGNKIKGYEDPNAPKPAAPTPQPAWTRPAPRRDEPPSWSSRPPPREQPRQPDWTQQQRPDPYRFRYFKKISGNSRKFWEIKPSRNGTAGATVTVTWGRIGSAGETQTKTFPSRFTASEWIHKMITSKIDKGYHEYPRPAWRTDAPPPTPKAPRAAGTRQTGAGGAKTYKVYGTVKGKVPGDNTRKTYMPHTRVKGKAYTKTGDASKFRQNDQVSVNVDAATGKAKVSGKVKQYGAPGSGAAPTDVDHSQDWDPVTQEARRFINDAVIDVLYEQAFGEAYGRKLRVVDTSPRDPGDREPRKGSIAKGLEARSNDTQDRIGAMQEEPEFRDADAFAAYKLDNDDFEYSFEELQALARNATARRTGNSDISMASPQDVASVRAALEGEMGFKYIARQPVKDVRGVQSSAHGTHPFAGAGGGGSGFGSDLGGGTFTSFGGGPGAVGGDYAWNPDDPKNLPMGAKKKRPTR